MNVVSIVAGISAFCAMLIPIITLGSMAIPPIRKKFTLAMKKDMEIDSIKESIDGVKDNLSTFKKEYYSTHEDLTNKMIAIEKSVTENTGKMDAHLASSEKRMQTDLCLLRETLITKFKFFKEQGYVTYDELESLQIAYTQYREMGGNGVIKHKWETEILKLPIK